MERLRPERPKGMSRAVLRKWGMLFIVLGVFGRSILQTRYLGLQDMTPEQMLEAMNTGAYVMLGVTVAIVLQFMEACATPIFCLLLADGFVKTSDRWKYIGRIAGLAFISEIPYNYAMFGKFLETSSRNPVFGMVFAAFLLYLYEHYGEKKFVNLLIKALVTVAAVIWCVMLKIEHGVPCVILTSIFWGFRKKPMIRNFAGAIGAVFCSLYSMFYMVSPMSVLALHFYNGEKGEENRLVSYLLYPMVLIGFGIVGTLAF